MAMRKNCSSCNREKSHECHENISGTIILAMILLVSVLQITFFYTLSNGQKHRLRGRNIRDSLFNKRQAAAHSSDSLPFVKSF